MFYLWCWLSTLKDLRFLHRGGSLGCQAVSRSRRGRNIHRNRSGNQRKIYKGMLTYGRSARKRGSKYASKAERTYLCIAFGRKLYIKLSVDWKHRNIKDYKRHTRAELSAPWRAWAELSQPQGTAETAVKGSKRSIRHRRLQSEVQIMDTWADNEKERTRKPLRTSLSWNSSPTILSLLPGIPRALSLSHVACAYLKGEISGPLASSSRDGN